MIDRIVHDRPVKTQIIRTHAAGPEPANTLVYLRCRIGGVDVRAGNGQSARVEVEFPTEFRIDGYQQSRHDWFEQNTLVSATAALRFLNTTTDLIFTLAIDRIEPFLKPDGVLGFVCTIASIIDDEAIIFGPNYEVVMSGDVSAYVLCYEPQTELPPSGAQRSRWAKTIDASLLSRPVRRFAETANDTRTTIRVERPKTTRGDDPSKC